MARLSWPGESESRGLQPEIQLYELFYALPHNPPAMITSLEIKGILIGLDEICYRFANGDCIPTSW
ncbi:hypothetical protein BN77_0201 [Rhizobium mesoamericanum STM3625]|uniref:Uncharacterized protein n=1 Tax=Rhizobium mesoamericanum STM3625 TaxID=1211777 RepID=K0PIR0_9HYPH|nr:hypothetical protein BN77_0201 [Rhizobium mesoamericanum STM3625]